MIDARELLKIHLKLECKLIDPQGFLIEIPCTNPDGLHRLYVVQYPDGFERYFSHDLPYPIRQQLSDLSPEIAFSDTATIKAILAPHRPCDNLHIGKSYVFPETISPDDYPDVTRLNISHRELMAAYDSGVDVTAHAIFVIIAEDRIVSTCESSREDSHSGEAWVRTLPEFRQKGYARQVTAAWGHDLQMRGKIPFYSHILTNAASESVARSLGLLQYMTDAGYE